MENGGKIFKLQQKHKIQKEAFTRKIKKIFHLKHQIFNSWFCKLTLTFEGLFRNDVNYKESRGSMPKDDFR